MQFEFFSVSHYHTVSSLKASAAGKKYKFVITGHGKYEKIAVDDEVMNGKSGEFTDRKC